jgi:hypothetical protein
MNWTKFLIAFVVTFVFLFGFGFLWFGTLMHGAHMEVPSLWRPEADFNNHFTWLILGHVVMAFFLVMLYARHGGGTVSSGTCLGFLVGLVYSGNDLINYAIEPITTKILCGWIVGDILMFAIAGALIGAIYKPNATSAV